MPLTTCPTTRPPRRLRHLAAALSLLVVAGCGSDASGGSSATTVTQEGGSAETTAAPGADAFPVTIEHAYGSTEITEAPTRVAVVGLTEQDALLALGIVPVATTEWFGGHDGAIWPWAQDELEALGGADITVLEDTDGTNVEAVAATRPDLILGIYSGMTEDEYASLSAIAPTVAAPEGTKAYGVSWQDETLLVARAVGQAAKGQELIDDLEERFAEVRADHPEFEGRTAAFAMAYEGTFVYGADDPRGRFMTSLGFEIPAELTEVAGDQFGADLPDEQAELLDTDVIVWLDAEEADEGTSLGGPLYAGLAVHTEGREVFLDSEDEEGLGGATSFQSVLSLPELIDGLVPMLVAAVDGDPATDVPT